MSRSAPPRRFRRPRRCSPASAAAARPYVSLLGSREHTFFTDGARELFDCAGQGRIDVFFLSGGQIDGEGNINLVSVGDYDHPKARFPGSFGSAYLYYVVPKVILFRVEHSRRTLVPKVDFVSAPGGSPDNVFRPGGPIALVTNRCLFDFDRARRRFRLASVHPGHSVAEVIENTGFDFDRPAEVPVTPAPSAETLHLMRSSSRRCWPRSIRSLPRGFLASSRSRHPEVAAQRPSKDAAEAPGPSPFDGSPNKSGSHLRMTDKALRTLRCVMVFMRPQQEGSVR